MIRDSDLLFGPPCINIHSLVQRQRLRIARIRWGPWLGN